MTDASAAAHAALTLLHTSATHVPVFDALRDRDHPGAVLRHLVVPELLDRARAEGPEAVAPAVRELLGGCSGPVLVTCSTIGAVVEAQAGPLGVALFRVDRPMAAEAVRIGGRITVLASLESTLAPTAGLLAEEAGTREVSVRTRVVAGAWDRFAAGDEAGSLALVAEAIDAVTDTDVILLAQGSMAGAAASATTLIPVLTGPARGLAAALGRQSVRASAGRPSSGGRTAGVPGKVGHMVRIEEQTQPPVPGPDPQPPVPGPDPTPGPRPFPDPEPPTPRPAPPVPGPVPEPDPIPAPPGPAPVPQPGPLGSIGA
ncbi:MULTISPECIES: arylsulfatase [unclassified Streptomyces]|uniref:arylsulfatase n=1 Tax=unclassified Streptomyces TaxID=2593676 RepID=UPI002B1E8331|nr:MULTISPECIES: arylsulfatase [unclassified Streptomyces]